MTARFNKMHGALRALHVSPNNASKRTVCKCLQMNNGHLITLQQKFEWNGDIMSEERRMKLFWNLHQKPRTVSELKISLEKIWDIFLQVQLIKLSWVLQVIWQEYVNSDRRHSKHLFLLKKCSPFRHLCCLGIVLFWTYGQFLITSQMLSCHD